MWGHSSVEIFAIKWSLIIIDLQVLLHLRSTADFISIINAKEKAKKDFPSLLSIFEHTSQRIPKNYLKNLFNLSANPTKLANTLRQFVGCCRRIVWVCLTILRGWCLKAYVSYKTLIYYSKGYLTTVQYW